jgi:hypothetical protein
MAFVHGSKAKVYFNGFDVSTYLRSYQEAGTVDSAETSTFGNLFKTYVPGLSGFSISSEGIYDGAANAVDDLFQQAASSTGDDIAVFMPQGDSFGAPGYGALITTSSVQVTAEIGNVSSISYQGQGDGSIDRVLALSALGAQGAAYNGASIDNAALTTAGGVLYVIQTASAAGSTYTVQDSADNSSWATLAGCTFILPAGNAAGRIAVAGTVRRYVRINSTLAGTFGSYFSRK